MSGGVLPFRMRVARPTRADWRGLPPSPADGLIRSLRCCGSRPSGPPPEPLGKDEITCTMVSGLIENGSERMGFKAGRMMSEGMWGGGGGALTSALPGSQY